MSKAIINLPSIDMSTEFTENASICDSLAVIEENLKTALELNYIAAKKYCGKSVDAVVSIFKYIKEATGDGFHSDMNIMMYRDGLYKFLSEVFQKETPGNELKDINDELVEFIINYRSPYTFNEVGETLKHYSLIEKDVDEDEYF